MSTGTFTESNFILTFLNNERCNNLFHISLFSSGIDFKMKTISLGGKTIKVQIW